MSRRLMFAAAAAAGIYLLRRSRKTHKQRETSPRGPMTPATSPANAAAAPVGPVGRNLDSRLDEGLQESFPASDPVSVHVD
jgi:hypothetical protein